MLDGESRNGFLMYKLMHDKGFLISKKSSIDYIINGFSFDVLLDLLDMIPNLYCDPFGLLYDEDGKEIEDENSFDICHPLIIKLGIYERKFKEEGLKLESVLSENDYKTYLSLVAKENNCVSGLHGCFYYGSIYFSDDWTKLQIISDGIINEVLLLSEIISYLETLEKFITFLEKHTNIFKE